MLNTIGHRETEKALQLGTLYSAEDALRINLVDELAEPDKVLLQAEEHMKKWLQIPSKILTSNFILIFHFSKKNSF